MALDEHVWALAAEGASVLVGAAGTSAWTIARREFTRILAGGDGEREAWLSAHLDAFAARLEPAGRDERERLRTENAPTWLNRFVRRLEEDPDAAVQLRKVVDLIKDVLGAGYEGWAHVHIVVAPDAAANRGTGAVQGPPPGPEFPTPA